MLGRRKRKEPTARDLKDLEVEGQVEASQALGDPAYNMGRELSQADLVLDYHVSEDEAIADFIQDEGLDVAKPLMSRLMFLTNMTRSQADLTAMKADEFFTLLKYLPDHVIRRYRKKLAAYGLNILFEARINDSVGGFKAKDVLTTSRRYVGIRREEEKKRRWP